MKKDLRKYRDRNKTKAWNMLKKVNYFEKLGKKEMHEIVYRLHMKQYLTGDLILKVQDDTSQLILLVSGSVEYVTECDDNEFVMKILEAGSIINPRNVIIDELMYVDIR